MVVRLQWTNISLQAHLSSFITNACLLFFREGIIYLVVIQLENIQHQNTGLF